MSEVFDWDDLGPNDVHHHSRSENGKYSDSIGRSRLKARLFQGQVSDPQTAHTTHVTGSNLDVSSAESVCLPSPGIWDEDQIQIQKERNLRLKAQKSAFEARDKILELSVKLHSAEGDALMWKEAASLERETKEKAEKERDIVHVSSLALETKVKAGQERIAQLESENKHLLERILEVQEQRDNQGMLLQDRSDQCTQLRVEIANHAANIKQRTIDLRSKESLVQDLEQAIEHLRHSCRDVEEKLRVASERRDELEVTCERYATRMRNLEASVSIHATRALVMCVCVCVCA
jgi:chromosome segregation ATPase